ENVDALVAEEKCSGMAAAEKCRKRAAGEIFCGVWETGAVAICTLREAAEGIYKRSAAVVEGGVDVYAWEEAVEICRTKVAAALCGCGGEEEEEEEEEGICRLAKAAIYVGGGEMAAEEEICHEKKGVRRRCFL
ncbi:hypothetical protein KI387_028583, partial [Taxus chinensis]